MRTPILLVSVFTLAGCATDTDRGPFLDGGPDAAADTGAGSDSTTPLDATMDAAADATLAVDAGPVEGLRIEFDYRYDTAGFFSDPARRQVLEAAARTWGSLLVDDFEAIPAGTSIRTRDPEAPSAPGMSFPSDAAIDDVLIFVGCATFEGGIAQSNNTAAIGTVTDGALATRLRARYEGPDFEPWTGWISFLCDADWYFDATLGTDGDIPGGANDFYSTAMHELAHVLGFGTADAYFAQVSGGAFVGPAAVAAHGGPVPLTASGVHFQSSVRSEGQPTLMDPSRTVGTRTPPTSVDRAVMTDLGYEPTAL